MRGTELTHAEKAAALAEAKARGLPPGWDVTLDKRKRRKWIAPNGRSCDSIPKALTMSVEMGMLPPDTFIPHPPPKRKRGRPPGKAKRGRPPKQSNGNRSQQQQQQQQPILDLTKTEEELEAERQELARQWKKHKSQGQKMKPPKKKKRKELSIEMQEEEDEVAMDAAPHSEDEESVEEEDEEEEEMEPPTDPETTLQPTWSHLTTVHWDPNSAPGRKVGWFVRVSDDKTGEWYDGRILRYDPCTHKHKIQFAKGKTRSYEKANDKDGSVWIHLRMEDGIQIASQLVWARVKGYAWWPAMVMDSDLHPYREGYRAVEFIGSGEVATLRVGPETLRPFVRGQIDSIIAKNKKKRNANAIQLALTEEAKIQQVRNEAAKYYARQAFAMSCSVSVGGFMGKKVQLFRSDVNYPYGETVVGKVKQYSPSLGKWLVVYEYSDQARKKYEASWVNLKSKEHKVRILDKGAKGSPPKPPGDIDLIPFLVGFQLPPQLDDDDEDDDDIGGGGSGGGGGNSSSNRKKKSDDPEEGTDEYLAQALEQRCHGCTDYWKKGDTKIECKTCQSSFHLGCANPPLTPDAYQKLHKSGEPYVCSRCIPCKGCYQHDIAFGSHVHAPPPTLSIEEDDDEKLHLCSMCTKAYGKGQFCPNCAHSWDDDHFQHVQRQIRWQQAHKPKKRGRKRKSHPDDPNGASSGGGGSGMDWLNYTAPAVVHNEDPLPQGAKVNPTWYHAETGQWGYTEVDMLTCDSCKLWVHAGCAGLDEDEYEETSDGKHPIYSTEFLCKVCCKQRCLNLIQGMQHEDNMLLFAEPVSEKVAPNYLDMIKRPMDLQTMLVQARKHNYKNYAWVRELFELMVINALTFNRPHTPFWKEAKRFYQACLDNVFKGIGKAAPPGKYEDRIQDSFAKAEKAKKLEQDRVQEDKSTEKKDLVAGAKVSTVTLPSLREKPFGVQSCVPSRDVKIKPTDAYFTSWMDTCYTCGSSGASDTMLFCVDCGEGFHSFCANAPIHSMEKSSAAGWRCPNCKICEISGFSPEDEQNMLFCEMCDRGFSLDKLDPPLKFAPPGIWVCGQCVDCKKCGNTLEPNGPKISYWSRDPHLCYRCGGCDGLVDRKARKCGVCSTLWRDGDTDLAQCEQCGVKVKARCDPKAQEYVNRQNSKDDVLDTKNRSSSKYSCPTCSKKQGGKKKDTSKVTRGHLYDHATKVVQQGAILPGEEMSRNELQEKLMEQIDWKTRNLWRDEYRRVVLEGVRFLGLAREQFGDARYLMDRFWEECDDLAPWMGQRATRFIHIAKKLKLETFGFSARRIEQCVMISKLSASWLKVACRVMGLKTKRSIKGYDRVVKLLKPPHESGAAELTYDSIRCERNRNIINKDEWLEKFESKLNPIVQTQVLNEAPSENPSSSKSQSLVDGQEYKLATAVCGWNDIVGSNENFQWYDPRICVLCHMCGDDDAGHLDQLPPPTDNPTDIVVPKLGRLLPMGDGDWVHASCALWSSETWESPSGGVINAMEKAKSRGAQLKCFGCGRQGATVGCVKGNCNFNYHFPCAHACGAVFTSSKEIYCKTHKDSTKALVPNPSIELMKTLVIAPEKAKVDISEAIDSDICLRVGALTVHSLGTVEQDVDGFHSVDYITPPGYLATRIFWSTVQPKTRTIYVLTIEKSPNSKPIFSITPADNPSSSITASTSDEAYRILMKLVDKSNGSHFANGDPCSKLPTKRGSRKGAFGLNGPQFFGYGTIPIRKALENISGVEAVVAPIHPKSPQYVFCYTQPTVESIMELQRKRAAVAAEQKLENTSGCARTEGIKAVARSGGSDRITRALVRNVDNDNAAADVGRKQDSEKAKADRSRMALKYRQLNSIPIEQRLVAKRSHIHGWGLFTKQEIAKDSMIVEYMGEIIRQSVADRRERKYEISGEGSCYMFRLDMQRIVDATKIGCMARFMNHCCSPNAYAKVITVDTDLGVDKKIMVFALQDIKAGEEITYDYKFPVEDGSLKCSCGAPNCIGRLN